MNEFMWEDFCEEIISAIKAWDSEVSITADDIEFDASRSWSLSVSASKLGLPYSRFGAWRAYLGGGVRGSVNHNGEKVHGTMELGELFAKKLKEIEDIINEGYEDSPSWELPTGVLLK